MKPVAAEIELAFWVCPWCLVVNFRNFEGLDECCHCGSEVATYYAGFGPLLKVKWAREPKRDASIVNRQGKLSDRGYLGHFIGDPPL